MPHPTPTDTPYVSTGQLPPPELVAALVAEAHERFMGNTDGVNSQVYPALARVPNDLFGICVVGTSGNVYAAGNADYEFTIMSVSKPFIFALVCEALGVEEVRQKIGVNATGRAFNSLEGIERGPGGRTNPMVNSGAIATTSLVPGETFEAKWKFVHDGLSRFAGRTLPLNDEVYVSASETNFRNQSIARMLQSFGRIYDDPARAVDLYTKQCALNVSARDLAVMGATLVIVLFITEKVPVVIVALGTALALVLHRHPRLPQALGGWATRRRSSSLRCSWSARARGDGRHRLGGPVPDRQEPARAVCGSWC
jgi:glutaminase